ncbi:MAG: biotin carboxylase N-terminal domain-containing protein [Hyphomonadaceae bacterium]
MLIANRGEIARRINNTARRLGVRTVAVFTEWDEGLPFVREASTAYQIESYLDAEAIIAIAKDTGAEAIHPGYGFLSENPDFADAVIAAGLVWVGPQPASIRAMGLKDAAKALMEKHGVPVTPGYHGEDQSPKRLKAAAKEIGYPVLIKAVAGGGGRGMRRVDAPAQFDEALASAQREAKAHFKDDRVLVEKLVQNPRHIEVQVFGDRHGNLVHMFERDCSLQRRRQKVIEESPAPGMTPEVRAAMTDAALRAAKAVNYENAGTVEFIVDGSGPLRPDGFWFMEMNTRLQVEHPVTEMVTGLDLVEWQLRVASGEMLPSQDAIELKGHAVEARVCAEDPSRDFLPVAGRLEQFSIPTALGFGEDLRVDSGFASGSVVPDKYDSMIAKLICHAPTRTQAFHNLASRLGASEVWPLPTNIAFLRRLLLEEDVLEGRMDTEFVERRLDTLATTSVETGWKQLALAAGAQMALQQGASKDPWSKPDGFRINAGARATFQFEYQGRPESVELTAGVAGHYSVAALGGVHDAFLLGHAAPNGDGHALIVVDGRREIAEVRALSAGHVMFAFGEAMLLAPPDYARAHEGEEAGDEIRSPMPGKVLEVKAKAGAQVKKGDPLVILEAMKMEHTLAAPRDGVIAEVGAEAGEQTAEGVVLVRLEAVE